LLKNGTETRAYHIPGRASVGSELDPVTFTDPEKATTEVVVITQNPTSSGTLEVTYGIETVSVFVGTSDTPSDMATAIVNAINADNNIQVTATLQGESFFLTEKRTGSEYNGLPIYVQSVGAGDILRDPDTLLNTNEVILELSGGQGDESEIFVGTKNFHMDSTADATYGMAYWENTSEQYPNTDKWVIKNSLGTQVGDLRNTPVRHHHFPKTGTQPLIRNNSVNNDMRDIRILGFKLTNVNIPTDLQDKIVGYRVYTAKRNEENKRVLDQTVTINARFESSVLKPNEDNDSSGTFNDTVKYTHPFQYLRQKINIGSLTHAEILAELSTTSKTTTSINNYTTRFLIHKRNASFIGTNYNIIEGKAYVNSEDVPSGASLKGFGINNTINNYTG
ncbi:MAG: hypothetical protein WD512_06830, partial [Candidatus Paceibacterota bacterium]